MPLVVLTGLPGSGKSTRCSQLAAFLGAHSARPVRVIAESQFVSSRDATYASVAREKQSRCALKSELQRHLAADSWTLLDALNYVKGYRYEVYCVARETGCAQLTIHCATDPYLAWQWNCARAVADPHADTYSRPVFDALVSRYESPSAERRWERPLLQLLPEEPTPCEHVLQVLTSTVAPAPLQSTQALVPTLQSDGVQQLDQQLQQLVTEVLQLQATAVEGDKLVVSGAEEPLVLRRKLTLAQWSRYRRQFAKYLQSRSHLPVSRLVPTLFVQYLNSVVTD